MMYEYALKRMLQSYYYRLAYVRSVCVDFKRVKMATERTQINMVAESALFYTHHPCHTCKKRDEVSIAQLWSASCFYSLTAPNPE